MGQNQDPQTDQLLRRLHTGVQDIERLLQLNGQLTADQRQGLMRLSEIIEAWLGNKVWTYSADTEFRALEGGLPQLTEVANDMVMGSEMCGTAHRRRDGSVVLFLSHGITMDPVIYPGHASIIVNDHRFAVAKGGQSVQYTTYGNPAPLSLVTASPTEILLGVDTNLADAVRAFVEALVPYDLSLPDETLASLADYGDQDE